MNYILRDQVEWKQVKYLKTSEQGPEENHVWKYEFTLPRPLADWDVFSYWESERIASMDAHLNRGDVLFDIGKEQGWCNLAYGEMVGPEHMVLIEPTREFWPGIRQIWEKNGNPEPRACLSALMSDKDSGAVPVETGWPAESIGDMIDRNKYQYIHDNEEGISEIKLDTWVERTGIVPDALTMDVEGAELLILRGAEQTLKTHHPKCWISVHPDLGLRDYGITAEETIKFMEDLGYAGEHLATDHEVHYYFEYQP